MVSPGERIAQIERELQKYTSKKTEAKTLSAIGANIGERIKILNDIHRELLDISKETYYYDMVDYLGNVCVSKMRLTHCLAFSKELVKASQKFTDVGDEKYRLQCERLRKRISWVGFNIVKDIVKNHIHGEEIRSFYSESTEEIKEKIRKCYFAQRMKDMEKNIKACEEDVEKHHQLLIMGEIIAYETMLGAEIDTKIHRPGTFGFYILVVFRGICTRKNQNVIKDILYKMANKKNITKVDELFMIVTKQHYARYNKRSFEI